MKGKFKRPLKNVVNSIRYTLNLIGEHPRGAIIIFSLGAGGYTFHGLAPNAYAGEIKTTAYNEGTPSSGPTANLKNSGNNVEYIQPMPGEIGIFFENGETKLVEKVIDINGTDPENMYAEIVSGTPGNEWWLFNILDANGLERKNIIAHRYGQDGVNDPCAVPEDTLDVWYNNGTWVQSGSFTGITSGIYDRIGFEKFNYADLNRDGKVNFLDFAIFASRWKDTGIDKGSDPTVLSDYADIDGNGEVNYVDLDKFCKEWLFDSNTIAEAMRILPKPLYEGLNETARKILDYTGQHNQRLVCKVYQNKQKPLYHNLSPDMIKQLARKEDVENPAEQEPTNHNHQPGLAKADYQTIDQKLTTNYQTTQRFSLIPHLFKKCAYPAPALYQNGTGPERYRAYVKR